MEDSDKPKETSIKPNNEVLVLKQLKSIKVALWTLVTVFVILPVIAGIGTGVVIGFIALSGDSSHGEAETETDGWDTSGYNVPTPTETKETEDDPSWSDGSGEPAGE